MSEEAPALARASGRILDHHRRLIRTWVEVLARKFAGRRSMPRGVPRDALLSIVVPTLAKGRHEDRLVTLKSLLTGYLARQTYDRFEVIVVSDGYNSSVEALAREVGDPRVRFASTPETSGLWGHPETRLGIGLARGDYFVRLNDDNRPFPRYLETLVSGFEPRVGVVYGRVVFAGEARRIWRPHFAGMTSYVLPNDALGRLHPDNVDCMNFMVRMDLARRHERAWGDTIDADWLFLDEMIRDGVAVRFVDELIGEKR